MSNLSKWLCLWMLTAVAPMTAAEPFDRHVSIYTEQWAPFIELNQAQQDVRKIVDLALVEVGIEARWEQLNYYHSFKFTEQNKISAAFPFFKTANRASLVLFSEPVYQIENSVFYDRFRYPQGVDLATGVAAVVGGYSYGETIDNLIRERRVFASDQQALQALFDGEVDYAPMSSQVAQVLTLKQFPNQYYRLATLPQYSSFSSVHVIAPKTQAGQDFISKFNRGLKVAKDLVTEVDTAIDANIFGRAAGIVSLAEADGYPIITAELATDKAANAEIIYLVPGTRAVVLNWSPTMLGSTTNEQIFAAMTEQSTVRLLDGPHQGKVVKVKNLHIRIQG